MLAQLFPVGIQASTIAQVPAFTTNDVTRVIQLLVIRLPSGSDRMIDIGSTNYRMSVRSRTKFDILRAHV